MTWKANPIWPDFEGHDLAELLRRCAAETWSVPVPVTLHIGCVVSRALVFLHEFDALGLVHRKLRLAKIRVGFAGEVKLLESHLWPCGGRRWRTWTGAFCG